MTAVKCIEEKTRIFLSWSQFIKTGKLKLVEVRPEIAQSWHRCYKAHIDPLANRSKRTLRKPQLDKILSNNKLLIKITQPFMKNLYRFVSNSKFVVLLCDKHGYILETIGDSEVINNAPDLNFCPGALWTEEEVGTNGVGTALALKKPFQVSGPEHYCRKHHAWTCSGAPIFDDAGQLVGVLEVSGPVEETHLHTLGMVVAAVEAIRHRIRNQKKNQELILLNNHLNNIFLGVSDGVIVTSVNGTILQVNPVAQTILERKRKGIEGNSISIFFDPCEPVRNMLRSGRTFADLEITVNTASGVAYVFASAKPIKNAQGQITGGIILINPINKIKKRVNRFSGAHATFHFKDIVGNSEPLLKAIQLATLAAGNDSNVLLTGESGTGKEIFAQSIHNESSRSKNPFIAVNCGAIPRELIGSELFGYAEGAFTGAQKGGRPGKFELASGGTLFLDEIGDMPLEQQIALLRVIQDKTITRIGGNKATVIDVRIICATHKDLLAEIAKGNFRQDIYYRLNVINIHLPPLRDRRRDIPLMFDAFFKKACKKIGRSIPPVISEVIERLQQYDWPGNAREFQNVIERMVSIANGQKIEIKHLPQEIISLKPIHLSFQCPAGPQNRIPTITDEKKKIKKILAEKERQEFFYFLSRNNGNVSQVARDMGISRTSLYRKLKKLNIRP